MYALLTKRGVKIPKCRPSSFIFLILIFCVFIDRDEVKVFYRAKKMNETNIQPSRPHACSMKDLLYCKNTPLE